MRNRLLVLVVIALATLSLACGQSSPVSPATATPAAVQPTAAPAQPTTAAATAVPPTATKPAATPTTLPTMTPTAAPLIDFSSLWSEAEAKAKSASRYRMSMSWTVGATADGVYTETPFIMLEGYTVLTDSYQVFTGGMLNELMGGARIEMISAGGKSYMKGSAMFGMMDPAKWYIMSEESDSSVPLEPEDMFNMAGSDTGVNVPKKTSSESLDGQSCDIWTWNLADNTELLSMLAGEDSQSSLSAIDKSEVRSWLCKDGYVHKVVMDITGHDKDDAKSKGAMKMESRMWDFDNPAIVITIPTDAVPFGE